MLLTTSSVQTYWERFRSDSVQNASITGGYGHKESLALRTAAAAAAAAAEETCLGIHIVSVLSAGHKVHKTQHLGENALW